MSELLGARGISKSFPKEGVVISVLRDVSLSLSRGESVVIVGQSGSGKSTLLQILGTLMQPTTGTVHFEGRSVVDYTEADLVAYRNQRLGFVFQFHHLLPDFTAVENAAMPVRIRGESPKEANEKARAWLSRVGLSHRETHAPFALSGGEQQRVAIARALVGDPSLVLADEPTGNLDAITAQEVSSMLFGLVREHGMSMIMATHNPHILGMADRVYRLVDGSLQEGA